MSIFQTRSSAVGDAALNAASTHTETPASTSQPWLYSAWVDSLFILSPALLATLAVLCFHDVFAHSDTSPWMWLLLVVGIDVAHVYATLFRSYLDPDERAAHPALFTLAPLTAWAGGALLYSHDPMSFWRVLAYLAVFHFVRQPYGFFMLYRRGEPEASSWILRPDKAAIYAATLYPLLYWHTHLPRDFQWFIQGDFAALPWGWMERAGFALYALIMLAYIAKEGAVYLRHRHFNIPRNLVLLGTAGAWYTGIVLLEGDPAFTVTNILAHGIPYTALVWIYGKRKAQRQPEARLSIGIPLTRFFTWRWMPLFIAAPLLLAFLEEGLWDGLVWQNAEHTAFFAWGLPQAKDTALLTWLVPLLAVPQATHYILDAFLWRIRSSPRSITPVLLERYST